MRNPLSILHLEDDPLDAELVKATLLSEGFKCEISRAATRDEFSSALDRSNLDVILADFTLPGFDGLSALSIARQKRPELPFIFVSGSLGEEVAIESLRSGATDYVLKHRMSRLTPALLRALEEVEQRRLREEFEKKILFQASLLDQVRNGIIATDSDGRIVHWNRFAETLFQWKADEVMGREVMEVTFPAKNREKAAQIMSELRSGGFWEGEVEMVRKDGSIFTGYVIDTLIRSGDTTGFVGVSIDITDRKSLEEQFRQAQKMEAIGRLAGGVAHDFNNLLTAIIGYSQILISRFDDDDRARSELEEIEKAGKRAAALTSQLLAFSRKQTMQPKMLNLNSIVLDFQKILKRVIGEDVEIEVSLEPDLPHVKADPGHMEQLIMNLAVNARDAMPHGGTLSITTSSQILEKGYLQENFEVQPGPYVVLTVSDEGSGMDEETKSRIFEPFFTTKEAGKGTGLGLSTVYGIIKQAGGHIRVESALGEGSTFRVFLPQFEEVVEAAAPEEQRRNPIARGSESILLVEDDPSVRNLASQVLRDHGYQVIEAWNGEDALKQAKNLGADEIDLVISDVVMPNMGGRAFLKALKRIRPGLKLLMISGYSEESIDKTLTDSGTGFLRKPFTPTELARRVREILDE